MKLKTTSDIKVWIKMAICIGRIKLQIETESEIKTETKTASKTDFQLQSKLHFISNLMLTNQVCFKVIIFKENQAKKINTKYFGL